MALNTINLVGRVGRDVETRYFESGSVKANTTLAVNRAKKDSEPDWFDIVFWSKNAQTATDYVRKGSLIGITGRLDFEYWQDRTTGADRSKPVIVVDRLDLLGSKRDNEAPQSDEDF